MELDLELYRRELRVSTDPLIRLSAIDIAPDIVPDIASRHARRTLVFVHGFGGEAIQWRYQLNEFAAAHRVIALDLRGHGHSDASPAGTGDRGAGGYSMAQIQDDLARSLALLKVEPGFVLVGHSFGGAVATEYAVAHPDQVARLILIATAGEFHLSRTVKLLLGLPAQALRLIQPAASTWTRTPLHVLKTWHQQTVSQWVGWSLFRSLSVPTLVIRGHWDLLFERPMFDKVPGAIPNAEDLHVGSSKHMVMLERRDAVNRAIARFVEGETTRSWRHHAAQRAAQGVGDGAVEASGAGARIELAQLRRSRPWLAHYDAGTPVTVAVPPIPVQQFLRSSARRYPQRTALWFEGAQLSYARLNHEVNRLANALRELGLAKQERVMLLMPNLPQMVIAYFATLKAGGVVVSVPLDLSPEELAAIGRETGAKVVVAWHGLPGLARLIEALPDETRVILAQTSTYLLRWKRSRVPRAAPIPGTFEFETVIRNRSVRSPDVEVSPDDLALIQYTSGTVARPKGVMLTHRNLVANTVQTRHWMAETREGKERFLCVLPFFHIYGLTTSLNLPIAAGATLYLKAKFAVPDVLRTIKRHRPTIFPGVPAMYIAIQNFPGVRKFGIDSVKACLSGSAPLPLEVQEAFEKLTRGRLVEGYGLTEAGPVTHGTPLHGLRKAGSIGIPLPSTEARVVRLDDRLTEVGVGEIGELAVRGPQVMAGYWNDAALTAQALDADGWLLTGDVAQMDADGYFHLIARRAEMWMPQQNGSPAFPRDIEEVLFEIPQVREAAVAAIENVPYAFVMAGREGIAEEAVLAYCRRRLPPELMPHAVIFVDEFPRNFIGKVLRRELARLVPLYKEDRQAIG